MKRHYYLMIDTETVGNLEDKSSIFTYDVGFAVIDKKGRVYEKYSFVVKEVFFGMWEEMQSAYYADKIPQYYEELAQGKREAAKFFDVRAVVWALCAKYNIQAAVAHNMAFDYNALNNTCRKLSNDCARYFFPRNIKIWCTLTMARQVITTKPLYKMWCNNNGYLTARGAPRCTAEILFRWITQDNEFIEKHTGLEDVMIEKDIFAYILRQHKAMRRTYWKE